jgi:hypothetical protein
MVCEILPQHDVSQGSGRVKGNATAVDFVMHVTISENIIFKAWYLDPLAEDVEAQLLAEEPFEHGNIVVF